MIILQLTLSELEEVLDKCVKRNLSEIPQVRHQEDVIHNVKSCAKFLGIAEQTVYTKTSNGTIPHMKKGKRLYFSQSQLLAYLNSGKRNTIEETEAEVDKYLSSRK